MKKTAVLLLVLTGCATVPEGPLSTTTGDIRVYVNQVDPKTYDMQALGDGSLVVNTTRLRTAIIDRARALCGDFDILSDAPVPQPMRIRCR